MLPTSGVTPVGCRTVAARVKCRCGSRRIDLVATLVTGITGSLAATVLAGAFAPHLTRRSGPAVGIHGIDEASSLPFSGSALRDGAVGQ